MGAPEMEPPLRSEEHGELWRQTLQVDLFRPAQVSCTVSSPTSERHVNYDALDDEFIDLEADRRLACFMRQSPNYV